MLAIRTAVAACERNVALEIDRHMLEAWEAEEVWELPRAVMAVWFVWYFCCTRELQLTVILWINTAFLSNICNRCCFTCSQQSMQFSPSTPVWGSSSETIWWLKLSKFVSKQNHNYLTSMLQHSWHTCYSWISSWVLMRERGAAAGKGWLPRIYLWSWLRRLNKIHTSHLGPGNANELTLTKSPS